MTTFAQIFFKFGQFSTAEIRNSNVFNNQERKIKDVQSSKKILKEIVADFFKILTVDFRVLLF
jgi:hypothetical protein